MTTRVQRLLLAAIPAFLAACGGSDSQGGAATADNRPDGALAVQQAGAEPGLLQRIASAADSLAYRGIRLVWLASDLQAGLPPLEFIEEIGTDGTGQFAIETEDVLSNVRDEELFIALRDLRQSFTFRYRDFRIRDLDRFQSNYRVRLTDETRTVAGIPCVVLTTGRIQAADTFYELCVDPATGLVLRWEQREERGGPVLGRVEFQTIEYDAAVSDMDLRNQRHLIVLPPGEHVPDPELAVTMPPSGYTLERDLAGRDEDGDLWYQSIYSDGVESAVFMHRAAEPDGALSESSVQWLKVGASTIVFGTVNGHSVILAGKVSREDLLLMLQSAIG